MIEEIWYSTLHSSIYGQTSAHTSVIRHTSRPHRCDPAMVDYVHIHTTFHSRPVLLLSPPVFCSLSEDPPSGPQPLLSYHVETRLRFHHYLHFEKHCSHLFAESSSSTAVLVSCFDPVLQPPFYSRNRSNYARSNPNSNYHVGKKMVEEEKIPLVPQNSGVEAPRKGTIFSSVFVLTTSCVGAGTLSVAYAFSKGGLAFSIAVFLVIIASCLMAAIEMLDAKKLHEEITGASPGKSVKINSFPTLGEAAFGVAGKVSEWYKIQFLPN